MIFLPLILCFSHFQPKINFGSRDGKRHINDEIEKSNLWLAYLHSTDIKQTGDLYHPAKRIQLVIKNINISTVHIFNILGI